jgi:Flp pilus assembly pilin Flp
MKPWSFWNPWLGKVIRDSKGQTLVEYGLVLLLIAVVVMISVKLVSEKTCAMYSKVGSEVGNTVPE